MEISLETQPAKSPDTNILDLSAWWSVDSIVRKAKNEGTVEGQCFEGKITQVINASWQQWDAKRKLPKMFKTLEVVLGKIIETKGEFVIMENEKHPETLPCMSQNGW